MEGMTAFEFSDIVKLINPKFNSI